MFWLFLLGAVLFFAIAIYFGGKHYRDRARSSAEREAAMLALLRAQTRQPPAMPLLTGQVLQASTPQPDALSTRSFLTPPQRAAYFLLRLALPEYEVFARVPLAEVLHFPRDPDLDHAVVDFLICSRDMEAVAVVLLEFPGKGGRPAVQEQSARFLSRAGIGCALLDIEKRPSRHEVRDRVLGNRAERESARKNHPLAR